MKKFMTKEVETVMAVVGFYCFIRFIFFQAYFETTTGDMFFDMGLVIFSGIFGIVYSKMELFEWQDHSERN